MKTAYAVATFVSLVVVLHVSPAPQVSAVNTASAAASCPAFLNQEFRKLHSDDSVNLCALGAGKPERAERAVWRASFYNMCFLGAVGLLFVLFADQIVSVFTQAAAGPEVHRYGSEALRIIACGFLFYAYGMVITQSFNGAGDTWTQTIINLFVFWALQIPLAHLLAHRTSLGPIGVFITLALSFSIFAVVSGAIFRQGHWKRVRV